MRWFRGEGKCLLRLLRSVGVAQLPGAFQCELQVFLDGRAVAGNIGECLRKGEAVGHQNVNAESALQYARQGHPETF